jgi:hypothetical protein
MDFFFKMPQVLDFSQMTSVNSVSIANIPPFSALSNFPFSVVNIFLGDWVFHTKLPVVRTRMKVHVCFSDLITGSLLIKDHSCQCGNIFRHLFLLPLTYSASISWTN